MEKEWVNITGLLFQKNYLMLVAKSYTAISGVRQGVILYPLPFSFTILLLCIIDQRQQNKVTNESGLQKLKFFVGPCMLKMLIELFSKPMFD